MAGPFIHRQDQDCRALVGLEQFVRGNTGWKCNNNKVAQPTQRGWTPTDYLFCLLYFVQIVAIGGWPRGVGSPALSFRASTIRAVGLATCRMLCALWIAMWINGFAVWMTNIQFEYESFGLRKLLRRAAPPQKAEFIWRSSTFAVTLKNACYILTYPKSHLLKPRSIHELDNLPKWWWKDTKNVFILLIVHSVGGRLMRCAQKVMPFHGSFVRIIFWLHVCIQN